jgi:hypothetical protein
MIRVLKIIHVGSETGSGSGDGSETNRKVGSGYGFEKNHPGFSSLTRMQVLDLDIRIKSLEESLASSEATLRGEASLAAAKVLLFNGFLYHNTHITLPLISQSSDMQYVAIILLC